MIHCLQCGAEQDDSNVYCTKCGSRLGAETSDEDRGSLPEDALLSGDSRDEEEKILRELKEALKVVEEPKPNQPAQPKSPTAFAKRLWITALALVVTLALVISLELFRRSRYQEAEPPPAPTSTTVELEPDQGSAEEQTRRETIGRIGAMLEGIQAYEKARKTLPPSLLSLNRSYAEPENLRDSWGQGILYLVDLTHKTFVIRSFGPDGQRDTPDDVYVTNEEAGSFQKQHEQAINEWKVANPNLHAQMTAIGPSPEELRRLEAARKAEEEKKKQQQTVLAEQQKREEQKRLEATRLEEERRKLAEAKQREEELRQAKARQEALQRQRAEQQLVRLEENFIDGLSQWDAPSSWEIIKEKDSPMLRVQGLGFTKQGGNWRDYRLEFELKINKESAGWVIRARDSSNFYLFKLASDRAKAIPKNTLVKYIYADGKYLNSLKRDDAPGAAGVIPMPFKVRNRDFHKVVVMVKGNTMTHYINGIQVDSWTDDTFDHGRFGFNASIIEQATIRTVSASPAN
ncbi:MAG: hypothetical protein AB1898_01950 [Acidobacteriota bacterium]